VENSSSRESRLTVCHAHRIAHSESMSDPLSRSRAFGMLCCSRGRAMGLREDLERIIADFDSAMRSCPPDQRQWSDHLPTFLAPHRASPLKGDGESIA
jgi:hypothetical protein